MLYRWIRASDLRIVNKLSLGFIEQNFYFVFSNLQYIWFYLARWILQSKLLIHGWHKINHFLRIIDIDYLLYFNIFQHLPKIIYLWYVYYLWQFVLKPYYYLSQVFLHFVNFHYFRDTFIDETSKLIDYRNCKVAPLRQRGRTRQSLTSCIQ